LKEWCRERKGMVVSSVYLRYYIESEKEDSLHQFSLFAEHEVNYIPFSVFKKMMWVLDSANSKIEK
jgi:hypothetical protein